MAHMDENAALGQVTFTCPWCGGRFTYRPNLISPDLGVQISVNRIGAECVRHTAGVVDLRTLPGGGDSDG